MSIKNILFGKESLEYDYNYFWPWLQKNHAEICPVCLGKGKIKTIDEMPVTEKTCHGCSGRGWVIVP